MYVFKIIPLLNPDGVYKGYYRSDVLGHNLNRVYMSPKRETQPSIYAVRKLIRLASYNTKTQLYRLHHTTRIILDIIRTKRILLTTERNQPIQMLKITLKSL